MNIPDGAARLATRIPDGRRPQVMRHRWESLLFLHWRMWPAKIQATLPKGLTVDTFDGAAFIGIVPFFMRNVRLVGSPAIPWLSEFQELNVRTYVYDQEGIPGVWFYSLDCNQPLAVAGARLLTGLPYRNATMTASPIASFIDYTCRRNGTPDVAQYRYSGVGIDAEPADESLESFLLDRYYLYAVRNRALLRAQVSHVRYRYRTAEVEAFSCIPARLDGFSEVTDAPTHQCFVDGFDVNIYATQRLH